MKIHYPTEQLELPYNVLGDLEFTNDNPRQLFIFPDIEKTLPAINPSKYYVTSGEAIQKTDRLISDLTELLSKAKEFKQLLIKSKGDNTYLELTKCEDGVYSGNVVARKNPKNKNKEG